jgi:hypothetical protein
MPDWVFYVISAVVCLVLLAITEWWEMGPKR